MLKLVYSSEEVEADSIPPQVSQRMKAVKSNDFSLEAAEAKLEYAQAQLQGIKLQMEHIGDCLTVQ